MGEEVKKEEAKEEVKEEGKKEEEKKEEEKKEEAKGEEEKKEEAKAEEPPQPPPPVVLQVNLHCVGCAKKIKRSILKCKGVEGVEVDMGENVVRVKGIVEPQALCNRIQKKTRRKATVISPVLPPPPPPEGDPSLPLLVLSQVSEAATVELKVNMHCEACAQQLQKKIQRMKGVQTVETDLSAAKVTVTGTVTGEKLVEYIYRRTGKLATVIPPPPPPKEEEKKEEESDKPAEEKPPEEKKEGKEGDGKKDGEKTPEEGKEKPEGEGKEEKKEGEEVKKEGELVVATNNAIWHGGYMNHGFSNGGGYMNNGFVNGGYNMHEEEMARRMMMMNMMPMPMHMPMNMPMNMNIPMHMPVYMIEQPPPPPQIFSDENPNACSIT